MADGSHVYDNKQTEAWLTECRVEDWGIFIFKTWNVLLCPKFVVISIL